MADELKSYEIIELIKKYTVSSILILPVFNDCYNLKSKTNQNLLFNQILFANGLLNCFLCFRDSKYYLILEFTKEEVHKSIEYLKPIADTINSLMIVNPFLVKVKNGPTIKYLLEIPEEFNEDINTIMDSKYSLVSELYKERIRVKHSYVGVTNHLLADSIVTQQISFNIAMKSPKIIEKLLKELDININELSITENEDLEVYEQFNLNKELQC